MSMTSPAKPIIHRVALENTPRTLREHPQWVAWRYKWEDDKWTKVPHIFARTRRASTTDPTTWTTFAHAEAWHLKHGNKGEEGVGFVLTHDLVLVFIDLDHCRDPETSALTDFAQSVLQHIHTYTEVSPSGTGLHLICRGTITTPRKTPQAELYATARYATVTGQHLDGTPLDILEAQDGLDWLVTQLPASANGHDAAHEHEFLAPPSPSDPRISDEELLARMRGFQDGEKFSAIFDHGAWQDYYPSPSEAVGYLVFKLMWLTRYDRARVDRMFRTSALYPWQGDRGADKWKRLKQREMDKAEQKLGGDMYDGALDLGDFAIDWDDPPMSTTSTLSRVAYYGVLGEIVRGIEPFIEADSAPLLVNLILASGVAMGHGPYLQVGTVRHYAILNAVTVAPTGQNKTDGTAPIETLFATVKALVEEERQANDGTTVDLDEGLIPAVPVWFSGLSTGEGVLTAIRDKTVDEKGETVDPGVHDKRLLVKEAEFTAVLKVMTREGNTLSPILRQFFDCPPEMRSSPKNNPIVVTGAHVGVIGQITPGELARTLKLNDMDNGFAGRYLWVTGKRLRDLPDPGDYSGKAVKHARLWLDAIRQARTVGQVVRDAAATAEWSAVYSPLRSQDGRRRGMPRRHGMARSVCARSHVQAMRIALIFAALDGSSVITTDHQQAALAVSDHCERCAITLFGNHSGVSKGDRIIDALLERGALTLTDIRDLFNRNASGGEVDAALADLLAHGEIREEKQTGALGRPATRYTLVEEEEE